MTIALLPARQHPPYLFIACAFVVTWVAVGYFTAQISGWRLLARRFRFSGLDFQGEQFFPASAAIRGLNFNNCLTFGAGSEGFYLRPIALFRFAMPALLVPWNELSVRRGQRWLRGTVTLITLGSEEKIPVVISARMAGKLQSAAGAFWPAETAG